MKHSIYIIDSSYRTYTFAHCTCFFVSVGAHCTQVSSSVNVSTLHIMFLQVWKEELWLEMSVVNYVNLLPLYSQHYISIEITNSCQAALLTIQLFCFLTFV